MYCVRTKSPIALANNIGTNQYINRIHGSKPCPKNQGTNSLAIAAIPIPTAHVIKIVSSVDFFSMFRTPSRFPLLYSFETRGIITVPSAVIMERGILMILSAE